MVTQIATATKTKGGRGREDGGSEGGSEGGRLDERTRRLKIVMRASRDEKAESKCLNAMATIVAERKEEVTRD